MVVRCLEKTWLERWPSLPDSRPHARAVCHRRVTRQTKGVARKKEDDCSRQCKRYEQVCRLRLQLPTTASRNHDELFTTHRINRGRRVPACRQLVLPQ